MGSLNPAGSASAAQGATVQDGAAPFLQVPHACRHSQLGRGGGCSRRPRARICDKSALEAGREFLVAGGFRRAHHGPEIWSQAAWANKVLQLCLTSNREPSEEIVLNAARGIVISKERRGRMFCGCRRETGSSASSGWCRSWGIWSTRSGRQPAWTRESAVAGCLGRAVPRPTGRGLARWRAVPGSAHAQGAES